MDKKNKLLAEQYLYNAASRYFDEEPTIVEAKEEKLDEKTITASLPDGRRIVVDDEDFSWRFGQDDANEYIGDDEPNANLVDPGTPGNYTGAAATAAKTALNKANAASRFGDRATAGMQIYNQLADDIEEVVRDYAQECIEEGSIAYDEDLGEWVIGNDDPKSIKTILSILEVKVYNEVIKPMKATLKKGQQDALLAAFHKAFTNPAHVKDGTPAFKGTKMLLKKVLNTMNDGTTAEDVAVDSEALQDSFYRAVDNVLSEMYAKRYDVKLDEATKMFIVKDTKLND